MTPATQLRFEKLNARMSDLGVRSLRFCWSEGAHTQMQERRAIAVADALERLFDGDYEVVDLATVDGTEGDGLGQKAEGEKP